jgi:hypothetical protein
MNPRDSGRNAPAKDDKRSFNDNVGYRDFRAEATKDNDDELRRVVGRLEHLIEEGSLPESSGRIVGKQLYAYRKEIRRRESDRDGAPVKSERNVPAAV